MALAADGSEAAVGGADGKVHLFTLAGDAATAAGTVEGFGSGAKVTAAAYSPDGCWFIGGDSQKNLVLIERATGKRKFPGFWCYHSSRINGLAFSPNSQFVASAGLDSHVYVWNTKKGSKRFQIKFAHKHGANCVAWTGDDDDFQGFIDKHSLTFPQISDNYGDVFSRFDVSYQPAMVIVKADGSIESIAGAVNGDLLDQIISEAT